MSSEHLASAQNELKGNLGGAWNILDGAQGQYQDLGIARRFGAAAAAYSLRDIGAMNGRVVKARRDVGETSDPEEDFSASQVQSGALEDYINGKLEDTLPADVATAAAAYSLRRVSEGSLHYTSDFSSNTDTIIANTSNLTLTGNIDGISDGTTSKDNVLRVENDATQTPQLAITNADYVASSDGIVEFTYYVPTGHPIIGSFWHIGTGSGIPNNYYTDNGVKIVGGTWTTAKLFFGSTHNGVDKPTTSETGGRRMLTIANNIKASSVTETVQADDGDIYYISALTFKETIDNAVRIRRSSDDVEVDVAFDSDDKVSASSAITNIAEQGGEIGSTTATDLNGFLNETLTVGVALEGGDGADRPDSFSNATNSSFTATVTEVSGGYFPYRTNLNDVIVVSFDIVLTGSASPSLTTSDGIDTVQNRSNSEVISSSGSYTKTLTCDQNSGTATHIRFADSDDGTFAVTNFRVVSHTHQAFVHTWYDQAGSNNATQTTDANQPKIAESGALITKRGQPSLKFRGTDSTPIYLDSSANITANFSFFIAAQPAADGTTSGSADNEKRNHTLWSQGATFHMAGINSDFTNGFRHGSTILSYSAGLDFNTNLNLHSLTNGSSNVDYFGNAVNKINTTNSTSTATSYDIGRKVNITSHNTRGYISEFIHYNSDQSANRFKIESNINNYYSLYNDENDLSSAFLNDATDPFDTFTGTKDGFVGVHDAPNTFGRAEAQLAQDGVSGNQYHISFNLDLNVAFVANKLFLALKAADGTTTTSTATYDVVEGFNSVTLEANATSRFIHFAFSIDDTVTYTVSNFKVSRIARNGFVETLYDQSGNSNNATQASAGQQPAIVQNGGICKSNGSPSVFFTGDTRDDELDFTDLTLTDATIFTVVNIDSSADQQIIIGGGSVGTSTGTMMPMLDNASSTTQVYKNSTVGGAEQGSSQFKNGSALTLADRDDAFDNLAVDSQILFTMVDVDVAEAKVLNGISRTPSDALGYHLQGQMNELIIYNSDLSSDRGTIESEIANHYNITLS